MSEILRVKMLLQGTNDSRVALNQFIDYLNLNIVDEFDVDIKNKIKFLLRRERENGVTKFSTLNKSVYIDETETVKKSGGEAVFVLIVDEDKLEKATNKVLKDYIKRLIYAKIKDNELLKEDKIDIEELCGFFAENLVAIADFNSCDIDVDIELLKGLMYEYTNSYEYINIAELEKACQYIKAKAICT